MAEQAVTLAQAGVAVFACNADKTPRTGRGHKDATTDPAAVAKMNWTAGAMIGALVPDGIAVIDVDPRNGGDATMDALKSLGHKVPRTVIVDTAGGGRHYYLAVPDGVALRPTLGQGVDVKRAGKGYTIYPPSKGYTFRAGAAKSPALMPEWMLGELMVPEAQDAPGIASDPRFVAGEEGTAYGMAARRMTVRELQDAESGSRNDALNRAAFALGQLCSGGELEEDSTLEELRVAGLDMGLRETEVMKTIESGWIAGHLEPRNAPETTLAAAAGQHADRAALTLPVDTANFWLDWEGESTRPTFLLDPVLPANAYVLVYGATEASKSMTFVAMCVEASHRGIKSTVYSLENPSHIDRDRLRRLGPDPANFRLTNEPLDVNDARQFNELVEREKSWGADIIMIDTYSHAFATRSEDGNAKAIEFARRIRFLMHETGATVVVIDHTGYTQDDEPRDASAKRQQVDVAILMERVGHWEPGRPSRFKMDNKKSSRFANPFTFTGQIEDGRDRALSVKWVGKEPKWA